MVKPATPAASIPLLEAIENASHEDLVAVRDRIKSCESTLASLRQVERILNLSLNGPVEPKRRGPRKAAAALAPGTSPVASQAPKGGSITDKYRRDVARLLMRGPARPAEICEECGIPNGSITAVLTHPWFGKNPDGSAHVTSLGRQAVSA